MGDLHTKLKANPPKFEVKPDAREVVIMTVSGMCDNKAFLTFRKNQDGDFRVDGRGQSLSNWQMKRDDYRTDLEWSADDQDWQEVIDIINSGVMKVATVRSR